MTTKWTKGPWSIDHCLEHKQKDDPGYFQIDAPVTCELTRKGFGYTVADTMNRDYCISPEEDRANAQLMASAPALYEALEAMLHLASIGEVPATITQERYTALLAAARGEQ